MSQSACVASHLCSCTPLCLLLVNTVIWSTWLTMSYQVLEEAFSNEQDMIDARPRFWVGDEGCTSDNYRTHHHNHKVSHLPRSFPPIKRSVRSACSAVAAVEDPD